MYQIVSSRGFRTSRGTRTEAENFAREHARQWGDQGIRSVTVTVYYYDEVVASFGSGDL